MSPEKSRAESWGEDNLGDPADADFTQSSSVPSRSFDPMPYPPLAPQARDAVPKEGEELPQVEDPAWELPEFKRYADRPTGTVDPSEPVYSD